MERAELRPGNSRATLISSHEASQPVSARRLGWSTPISSRARSGRPAMRTGWSVPSCAASRASTSLVPGLLETTE